MEENKTEIVKEIPVTFKMRGNLITDSEGVWRIELDSFEDLALEMETNIPLVEGEEDGSSNNPTG